jgi:hypothetical protein
MASSQRRNIRAVIQHQQQPQQPQPQPEPQRSMQEAGAAEGDRETTSDDGHVCSTGMLQGPYNAEPNVVPFQGLMFDIASREQAINIYTLTLHVKGLEEEEEEEEAGGGGAGGGDVDLSVDVWTTTGTFHASYFNESVWTRIVHAESTQMVRNPLTSSHGAVVIPAHAVETISMNPRERRALYVRMKSGSYLDYSVDAFVQDQAYTAKTDELAIYPGFGIGLATTTNAADVGTTLELFPQALERPLRPMFAGAIHYQTLCSSTVTTS